MMKSITAPLFALIVLATASISASAQSYPVRPMRFVVPFSPGGASDTAARIIGQKLGERWGQQVVIVNRPGAGGTIGTELAAKAQAGGYTLLMGSSTELAVNPNLYPRLNYVTTRDFTPIALIASTPLMLAVNPLVSAQSVKDLVVLAKANPGQLNYASSGNGGTNHLAAEMFKRAAGIDMLHVPHNGSALAIVSVMGGQTQMSVQRFRRCCSRCAGGSCAGSR